MTIKEQLFKLQDKKYLLFQSKLVPNISIEKIIGVRVPDIRKLAKFIVKNNTHIEFLNELPHEYFDENMLHGILISEINNYEKCIKELEKFLYYIDNWAVCDVISPKIFKENLNLLLNKIKQWIKSEHIYTCRFGIKMLMSHYLDKNFKKEYLKIPAIINSNEYYVNMMIAWFFATALAKQWNETFPYIKNNQLNTWVHNKTIQKATESYRITQDQKKLLKSLKK